MKSLTREQEALKLQAISIISDVTSIRNPDRIEAIENIIKTFGPTANKIKR